MPAAAAPAVPDPARLLAWYDRHRRDLPWRTAAGTVPDPYRVWLAEVMLQQTTVAAVVPYYVRFLARWPTLAALAAAPLEAVLREWAGLGYYARARHLHACAQHLLAHHGGRFPRAEAALRALPGIGAYTAAAIAAIAFEAATVPVDGNVARVVARLYALPHPLPAALPQLRRLAQGLRPPQRHGDFAQALMELGATLCTPKAPRCPLCPWREACAAAARGEAEAFPRPRARPRPRQRHGAVFLARRCDGAVLVRRRPARGLLGGMTELPMMLCDGEAAAGDAALDPAAVRAAAPFPDLPWRPLPGVVRHAFTHIALALVVQVATVEADRPAPPGLRFVPAAALAEEALPRLMHKVLAHADAAATADP